jgi:hypothetical protein
MLIIYLSNLKNTRGFYTYCPEPLNALILPSFGGTSLLTLKRQRGDPQNHPFLLPYESLASKIAQVVFGSQTTVEDLPFPKQF